MKLETSFKLFELKIKMRLWWMNHIVPNKKKILIGGAIFIVLAIVALSIYTYKSSHSRYFYIDMQGNKGVATNCRMIEEGLVCDRQYGGKIMVQQYWRGE